MNVQRAERTAGRLGQNIERSKKATGCPCCAGHKVCDCNTLEAVCPEVAADFDTEQNGVSAAQVTSSTKYHQVSVVVR